MNELLKSVLREGESEEDCIKRLVSYDAKLEKSVNETGHGLYEQRDGNLVIVIFYKDRNKAGGIEFNFYPHTREWKLNGSYECSASLRLSHPYDLVKFIRPLDLSDPNVGGTDV